MTGVDHGRRRTGLHRAQRRLYGRLLAVERPGAPVPCGGLLCDLWTSEDDAERHRASLLCGDCPLQADCYRLARVAGATWGVWGGVDLGGPAEQEQEEAG